MRCPVALVLGLAISLSVGSASAAGIKMLKTVEKAGSMAEAGPAFGLRVRAPKGTRLLRTFPDKEMAMKVKPHHFTQKSAVFQLDSGSYVNTRTGRSFTITPEAAIGPMIHPPAPWVKVGQR
jgi:hypothetical protein